MCNSSSDLPWTCTIWSMVSKSKRDTLHSIRATRHLPENIRIKRKDSNIESYRRNHWTSSKAALLAPYRLYLECQNNSEHHLSHQRTMYGNIHNRSSLLVVSEHMSHGSKYPTWELFLHGSVYIKLVPPAQCRALWCTSRTLRFLPQIFHWFSIYQRKQKDTLLRGISSR